MAKIARNAPCPCGSGKKQKHCCGKPRVFYGPKLPKEEEIAPTVTGERALALIAAHAAAVMPQPLDQVQ